jgi:hypothetical protein
MAAGVPKLLREASVIIHSCRGPGSGHIGQGRIVQAAYDPIKKHTGRYVRGRASHGEAWV